MPKPIRRPRRCVQAARFTSDAARQLTRQLSRVARSGALMRICQGVYMRPVEARFGLRAPRPGKAPAASSALWGETILPCGGAAANCLGLTTQNPVRAVYLISGSNLRLHFGSSVVKLRRAPCWKLVEPHRKAGDIVRALAWLGPEGVEGRTGGGPANA